MDNQQYKWKTTDEFAQAIKAKYPVYKDINNQKLTEQIIAKYPNYKSQIADMSGGQGYIQRVGTDIKNEVSNLKSDVSGATGAAPLSAGISAVGDIARAVLSPLAQAPGVKQVGELFGKAIEAAGMKVADLYSPDFEQKLAEMSPEQFAKFSEPIKMFKDLGDISNAILIAKGGQKTAEVTADAATKTADAVATGIGDATKAVTKVAGEIVPSADRVVNHQVTRALELTAGDVKNIAQSTGNEVGQFLADKNLIGGNKLETAKMVKDFYDTNYKAVREEIGKVDTQYKPVSVPRYVEALKAIKKQVDGVPGLEKVSVEVENLLNKKQGITLSDVQRVKELLDEHFNLYKVTGDIKEGVAKEGLSNMRSDLKTFIEQEVYKKTGADIKALNNDVATSRSISDAIEERSTRGLTASNIKLGDLGIFGVGSALGSPIFGVGALIAKKIIESSAVRLKVARYLDKVSDAKKLRIKNALIKGEMPPEITKIVEGQSSDAPIAQSKNTKSQNAAMKSNIALNKGKVKPKIKK